MSEITNRINMYASGQTTFGELTDFLIKVEYADPCIFDPDVIRQELEVGATTDGSFDEVTDANATGLLTEEEYVEIGEKAREAKRSEA